MAIQTSLESLANLRSTQANTASVEQSTFEKKETFGTRKKALELEYEQSEYMFHELMSNRDTRDALNELNYTNATQLHQVMKELGPEFVMGRMQVQADLQETKLGIAQLNQKYGMQYAFGQAIEEALSNGNPQEATKLTQQLNAEHIRMTGKPMELDFGEAEQETPLNVSDPNFALTVDHLPRVKSMNKVAKAMSDHGKSIELAEIQTEPAAQYYGTLNKQLSSVQKGLTIDAETMKQAGNALYGLPSSFTEKMELATDGSVMGGYNKTQLSNLKETIARLMAAGNAIGSVQQRVGTDLTVATNRDLPGVAWEDEVNFMHPTDPAFDIAEYERKIASLAESKKISAQAAADIMTQDMLNRWAGSFSGMVTG